MSIYALATSKLHKGHACPSHKQCPQLTKGIYALTKSIPKGIHALATSTMHNDAHFTQHKQELGAAMPCLLGRCMSLIKPFWLLLMPRMNKYLCIVLCYNVWILLIVFNTFDVLLHVAFPHLDLCWARASWKCSIPHMGLEMKAMPCTCLVAGKPTYQQHK